MNSFFSSSLQAILFDLDGTLIDTDDVAVAALASRLSPLMGSRAQTTARRFVMGIETPGNGLITWLDRLHLDQPLFHLKEWLGQQGIKEKSYQLIPGVAELITQVQGRYRLALVTTRSQKDIAAFLEQHPMIASVMETACGSQDTRRLKPHPAPVQLAAQRLGVSVQNCLMVGDTTVDVVAARRAGAWSVGVLCGFGERQELENAGTHYILETTAHLEQLLP